MCQKEKKLKSWSLRVLEFFIFAQKKHINHDYGAYAKFALNSVSALTYSTAEKWIKLDTRYKNKSPDTKNVQLSTHKYVYINTQNLGITSHIKAISIKC